MKRNLAAELTEGMQALAASRAGKAVHGIKRTLLTAPDVKAEYDALGDDLIEEHRFTDAAQPRQHQTFFWLAQEYPAEENAGLFKNGRSAGQLRRW